MMKYGNPIIRGYNPDPSICRVGEDYYLVTSSFEYFPGVPIYHSKNLIDWELINYCLTRDNQLNLTDCRCSGGIYAPTIRYHKGIYYMITTNVTDKGHFIVYTKDVRGEWSEPYWVEHQGIDPSLFFDDDGKVYFCSTHVDNGRQGIVLFEIDPLSGAKQSEPVIISYGCGGKYPEAPHLYKINGYYYLMMAEGGTEYGHMEIIFRSKNPYGPYDACPHNPILTHRDFMGAPIQATGHADIIEDANGNWWLVCLGIRTIPDMSLHNLGRETFLSPIVWDENGWPVVGNNGRIALEMKADFPCDFSRIKQSRDFEDNFETEYLNLEWNFVRNPKRENYSLTAKKGYLKLSAGKETLNDSEPTFLGVRQKEFEIRACTKVFADTFAEDSKVGLTAFYNKDYHYEIYVTKESGIYYAVLSKKVHDIEYVAQKVEINYCGSIEFQIETGMQDYIFSCRLKDDWITIGTGKTAGLCTEGTMTTTFTGTYLGIFASNAEAYFKYFTARNIGLL